jgi:prolipoprotein diacylglyceryltransferase
MLKRILKGLFGLLFILASCFALIVPFIIISMERHLPEPISSYIFDDFMFCLGVLIGGRMFWTAIKNKPLI